jgi:hypothetical protein
MENKTDATTHHEQTQKVQENQPKDEILIDIQTKEENLFLVRTKRSGMHAIQQND